MAGLQGRLNGAVERTHTTPSNLTTEARVERAGGAKTFSKK